MAEPLMDRGSFSFFILDRLSHLILDMLLYLFEIRELYFGREAKFSKKFSILFWIIFLMPSGYKLGNLNKLSGI